MVQYVFFEDKRFCLVLLRIINNVNMPSVYNYSSFLKSLSMLPDGFLFKAFFKHRNKNALTMHCHHFDHCYHSL